MKKNEVIIQKDNQKLIFSGSDQTEGKRLPISEGENKGYFEFENGLGTTAYANKKDPDLGKFVGERATGKKTHNFTGNLRHLFLCVNVRHANRQSKYPEIPAEFDKLYPVTKMFASKWGTNDIYIKQEDFTEEMREQVENLVIPKGWKEFCSQTSKTAKNELSGAPAKSKTGSAKKEVKREATGTDSTEIVQTIGDKILDKYPDWQSIDEPGMKKVTAACKNFGVTIKEIRAYLDSMQPDQDDSPSLDDLEF